MFIVWDQAVLKFITLGNRQQLARSIVLLFFRCSNKTNVDGLLFLYYKRTTSLSQLISNIHIVFCNIVESHRFVVTILHLNK